MAYLGKHGSRLGGNTGPVFAALARLGHLHVAGDIAAALRDAGLDIAETPNSKRDLARIQMQINVWREETGLPYTHLSRILALSIGENRSPEALREYMGD